jgi:hypothetical protein
LHCPWPQHWVNFGNIYGKKPPSIEEETPNFFQDLASFDFLIAQTVEAKVFSHRLSKQKGRVHTGKTNNNR